MQAEHEQAGRWRCEWLAGKRGAGAMLQRACCCCWCCCCCCCLCFFFVRVGMLATGLLWVASAAEAVSMRQVAVCNEPFPCLLNRCLLALVLALLYRLRRRKFRSPGTRRAFALLLAIGAACVVVWPCSSPSFCERQRAMLQPGAERSAHSYSVIRASLVVDPSQMSFDIHQPDSPDSLSATLSFLRDTVRIQVKNKRGRKRYQVEGVLSSPLYPEKIHLTETERGLNATWNECQLLLQFKPFLVEILRTGALVLSFNRLHTLSFEEEESDSILASRPRTSVGFDVTFHNSRHLFGLPEHADTFRLRPTLDDRGQPLSDPFRLYNLDITHYPLHSTTGLYGSVPFLVSHTRYQTTGAFFLNSAEMWIDTAYDLEADKSSRGAMSHWMAETGIIDVFLLLGPNPAQVFHQYATLTGFIELPPLFSLAYHQCRHTYSDTRTVASIAAGFDRAEIPLDVLWLDIEHTHDKKYFSWNPNGYSTPLALQSELASQGRKLVAIIDPHIKKEAGYRLFDEAKQQGFFIQTAGGDNFEGACWPGLSSWVDFLNPAARAWWASQFSLAAYQGSSLILFAWNDMNEPSVFGGPEGSLDKDAVHFQGWKHREVHNVYGMWMQAATADGLRLRSTEPHHRPFVLSRSFFAGSQKYGAVWTGDNHSTWEHLRISIPMLLSMSVAGISFAGADIGGFFGSPDTKLLTRWFQLGAFQPFMREHSDKGTRSREPYLFDSATVSRMREAIRLRYSLLPYWYSVFDQCSQTGLPVMRPLWVEFPDDEVAFDEESEFMIGSSLLIAPILFPNEEKRSVYFPGTHSWYDLHSHVRYKAATLVSIDATMDQIPVFLRGGAIIPRKMRAQRSTEAMRHDPFTLIAAVENNTASGFVYVDDYATEEYKQGMFSRRNFKLAPKGSGFVLESRGGMEGRFQSAKFSTSENIEHILILGFPWRPDHVRMGEEKLLWMYESSAMRLSVEVGALPIAADFLIQFSA
eukprot:m.105695 g.105695  ORF g.105695 m.105695 type:complete len:978 (+) comp51655_c0_seq1:1641-4574(+)